jgi:hypothetical protein
MRWLCEHLWWMERHTSTVAKHVLQLSETKEKDQMLEVCDLALARLVKRVRRRPGALGRMRVADATLAAEYLLGTGADADVVTARDALGRDTRTAMKDLRHAAARRQIVDEGALAARLETRRLLDEVSLETVREWSAYQSIDAHALLEWCLEDADRALAAAHLDVLDRRMVVLGVLDGTLPMSITGFLQASRLSNYNVRHALNLRELYTGELTNELLDLLVEHQVPASEWSFSNVSQDVVLRCVRRLGADQAIDERLCVVLYEQGLVDGWLLAAEHLTEQQRNSAALAAAQKRDFGLVNTLLAKQVMHGSSRSYRYDISELLSEWSVHHLSLNAVVECAQYANGDQLLRWAQNATIETIDAVAAMLARDGGEQVLEWAGGPRMITPRSRRLIEALVQSEACGKALRTTSDPVAGVVADVLASRVGTNVALWRMVLSLGEHWVGNLDELIEASHVCLRG